jgi:Domain of unknown function (DUF4384)
MSACPSRLELSRWEAQPEHERPVELASHVKTCEQCSTVLADISSARTFLLGADPALTSARAAKAILAAAEAYNEGRKLHRRWLRWLVPVVLVPATAALLFFIKPMSQAHRTMGQLIVETYCKRGENVFPAVDGADFLPGDRLRFAYTQDRPGFLLVFGVDDQGQVFPYYPQEDSLVAMAATAGAKVFLPGSVELDNHKGWERVFALWSETPLTDAAVRSAVISALSGAHGDVRRTTALDLPVEQVSLLLRRP